MSYYDLPKDKRWLGDSDSPSSIGGRSTDLVQLGYSLQYRVNNTFGSSSEMKERLDNLINKLGECEREIEHIIDFVIRYYYEHKKESRCLLLHTNW